MKNLFILIFSIFSITVYSQIKGKVSDENGNPISFVNIYVKDTYISTTTNDSGNYELNLKKEGTYTILYQYLGYKTHQENVVYDKNLQTINVQLQAENIELAEVVIKKGENPAIAIIKNAIANRKENSKKNNQYTADFYSRGIFRVKDLPKKILGEKLDMFDEVIDSTRSGILYLSETVSKITFQKPDKMKEVIIASKVSGKDNGFSFNNAQSSNFDFYENYLDFDTKVISPISDNAFNYYKYKFDGSFADENNQIINKIKVIARRDTEPVMEGYIYIVDDSWAIYATDLSIKGSQMQNPTLNMLTLKQNFSYNSKNKIWSKNTQTIDFDASMFGIKMTGKFTYVFSNFEFPEKIDKKTFTAEVIKFEPNANKKDDAFWNSSRPIPLTAEETADYIKKEHLQTKHKSQKYLDSIDNKRNKFEFESVLKSYTYSNTFKKWKISYDGPLMKTSFNTVQGWNSQAGLRYSKWDSDKKTFWDIGTILSYGFSENKLRPTFYYTNKFNNFNKSVFNIYAGSTVNQFNADKPISNLINMVSSLFFKDNYMKLYEKNFASANFSREIFNGLNMKLNVEYSERKPLFNTTSQSYTKSSKDYLSNNPLLPNDNTTSVFDKYNLVKTNLSAKINFGQKYLTRPDGRYSLGNDNYPTLTLNYEKGFAATNNNYNYDMFAAQVTHSLSTGNKGELQFNLKAGTFFNANNIAFIDYNHFNGNQTHIGTTESYTNIFNLLPYYAASTNKSYFEAHFEQNDKGYIMNKIPLINKLQSQLVLGFHNLALPDRKPYQEFSIGLNNLGFGKFHMLRIDYVRSYQGGHQTDGVIFDLKFLNILE